MSIGLHYDYNQLTLTKGQPCLIVLKNELTSINSSEKDIKTKILDRLKSIWFLPDILEDELTVDNLMLQLRQYIYREGMRMYSYEVESDGEDK